jgi:adenine-specific DNA-methyltransferase
MDEVFGADSYVNQIIWKRQTAHSDIGQGAQHLGRVHDIVLLYTIGENFTWNMQYEPYDETYKNAFYRHIEPETGRRFRLSDITGPGGAAKGNPRYEFLGVTRYWRFSKERMQALYAQGKVIQTSPGTVPSQKRYLDEMPGVPLQDIWADISPVQPQAGERLGYDTQKPEKLIERIIKLCSNEGDLVADFFVGSGTTAAVAQRLGRRWIACDLGRFAVHTTRKRLLDDGATFAVLNLGKYERAIWQGATLPDGLRAYVDFVLQLYRAEPVRDYKHLHGVKAGRAVHVGAVDSPVTFDEIDDVLAECRSTHTSRVDVLGWEWEFSLNEQAQQRAAGQGIDLRPYQIPNDVMDPRAKAADVKFYSLAYMEATTHTDGRSVVVELTDFIIPDLDLIPAAVRDKVKAWSDYIDYWAIDFDGRDGVFRNDWQSFRTRKRRALELKAPPHQYEQPGEYTVTVKVVDVFGIDSTKQLRVSI